MRCWVAVPFKLCPWEVVPCAVGCLPTENVPSEGSHPAMKGMLRMWGALWGNALPCELNPRESPVTNNKGYKASSHSAALR